MSCKPSQFVPACQVRVAFAWQINEDPLLRSADGEASVTRNTSVTEELGQIEYVFSDKTGN